MSGNGKTANSSAFVKKYSAGTDTPIWTTTGYLTNASIMPSSKKYDNLYIPGNLYIDREIFIASDAYLIEESSPIPIVSCEAIMLLKPKVFTYKDDIINHEHYGFVAQEVENILPNLVTTVPHNNLNNIKGVNYLELIPLLVCKIQEMSMEIDILKNEIDILKNP